MAGNKYRGFTDIEGARPRTSGSYERMFGCFRSADEDEPYLPEFYPRLHPTAPIMTGMQPLSKDSFAYLVGRSTLELNGCSRAEAEHIMQEMTRRR